ncbi:MAG: right-handed parallel beta-helix repeat-containing protein [Ilumatobacteraceae bacterium]
MNGDDTHDGHDRSAAMRTIGAAWQRIPAGTQLTTGYRMRLVAGSYPQATSVNYWEDRRGSDTAPIIIEAADGAHTATFDGDINMFGVSHFSLIGVDIVRLGDTFHCEKCDHILLRDLELDGGSAAHDNLKVNQSQYVFVEGVDVHGADDNAIDFVAVQYGHVSGSRIHDAQDWCAYAKGGSAYVTYSANEVFDCGTGGITAGQGTGFEFMVAPWLNYEAYGITMIDNVVHDTEGAGLGVAGGYGVVLAANTLYAIGTRSHVIEVVRGRRGCDGLSDACTAHHDAGGWGSSATEEPMIPDRHVYVDDNLVLNPAGVQSQWQQFQIDAPLDTPATSGVPSPAVADDDLRIVGNVVWNGPVDHPLGTGDGCPDTNASCNATQLRADNASNTVQPVLRDPAHGDHRLTDASRAQLPASVDVPAVEWPDTPLPVPAGASAVDIATDRAGRTRAPRGPPGAG